MGQKTRALSAKATTPTFQPERLTSRTSRASRATPIRSCPTSCTPMLLETSTAIAREGSSPGRRVPRRPPTRGPASATTRSAKARISIESRAIGEASEARTRISTIRSGSA
ncbi:hypothetical protein D3C87_1681420 [compost metagenome]